MKQLGEAQAREQHLLNCLLLAKGSPIVGWKPQPRAPIRQEPGFQAATRIAVENRMAEHAREFAGREAFYAEQAAKFGKNGNNNHNNGSEEKEIYEESESEDD
jgi:hypothetical protein